MIDVPEGRRQAAFRAVIAIAIAEDDVIYCEGQCEGVIAREERGDGGFGYDPIFVLPELGRSMAELSPAQKNEISHRGRAARAARIALRALADRA